MDKIISGYLWAWKNYESGKKSLETLRRYYTDSDIFINVDYHGAIEEYRKVSKELNAVFSINNFQVGYCGNHNENLGFDCWTREKTFEWVRGIYEACCKTESKYMMLLEEDDFILQKISLLDDIDFSMAVHPTDPSPIGWHRPNNIPIEYLMYIADNGGNSVSPGYAAGGGTIFNRKQFINAWEKHKSHIWENYDYLKSISRIIGWADYILQFVMQLNNHEIIQNHRLCEHWEVKEKWIDFEIVTGLKDMSLIEKI